MRIVTWNVNSIRARLERALDWVDAWRPDVLCLQEIKCLDEQFPAAPFLERGYQVETFGQKTYNGVAILSLLPMREVERGIPGGVDQDARGISALIEDIRVVNLYVVNGKSVGDPKYDHKLRWLDALNAWLRRTHRPTDMLCLCGDYNIAPEDIDVYDPRAWHEEILCSTPERRAFRALLEFGLFDAFRQLDQRPGQYSWWDMRTGGFDRGEGLRIDHLLVSAPLMEASQQVLIDQEERARVHPTVKPSDHAPVVLDLED